MGLYGRVKFPDEVVETFKNKELEYCFENGAIINSLKFSLNGEVLKLKPNEGIYKYTTGQHLLMEDWLENILDTNCYFDELEFNKNLKFYAVIFNGKKYRVVSYADKYMLLNSSYNEFFDRIFNAKELQEFFDKDCRPACGSSLSDAYSQL